MMKILIWNPYLPESSDDDEPTILYDDDLLELDNEDSTIIRDMEPLSERAYDKEFPKEDNTQPVNTFHGPFGPYFPDFTTLALFTWRTKHFICEYVENAAPSIRFFCPSTYSSFTL